MVETEFADPLIGSMLGKNYRVVESIGMGGMAVVYLVEHVTLQKQFAAKVLQAAHAASAEARARFTQEAHAASQLDHENIITISDFGITACGRPYFVMELLRGKTLAERLEEGPMTLEEVVAITVPAVRGLAHAHAEGLIHRDVKPENIFLVQRSQGRWGVKVLDFGIAKVPVNTGMTATGQALGSPMYMAPEACRGDEIDARADVYSFGILLYLMLTGQVPFRDDNLLKILQMQVLEAPPKPTSFNPSLPASLEDVILRALAKQPADRYGSMEELLEAFEQALPEGSDVLLLQAHLGGAATPLPGSLERVSLTARTITGSGKYFTVSTTGQHAIGTREKPPSQPPATVLDTRPIAHPPSPRRGGKVGVALVGALVLAAGGAAAYVLTRGGDAVPAGTMVTQADRAIEPTPAAPRPLPPREVGPAVPDPARPATPSPSPSPSTMAAAATSRAVADEPAPTDRAPKRKAAKVVERRAMAKTVEPTRIASAELPSKEPPAPAAPAVAAAPPPPPPEPVKAPDPTPAPAKPVAEPARPPAPPKPAAPPVRNTGSLDAKLTITGFDVAGSLPTSTVRRAVDRALPAIRACYQTAAKDAKSTPALTLKVRFEIDEGAAARSVSATGASFGSLAACAKAALQQVQAAQAPDVGTVQVAMSIRFTPT